MQHSVESKGVKVAPPFSFRRKEKTPGQFEVVRSDLPGTTDSYQRWSVEGVAADIKEAICRVSDSAFNAEDNANIPTVTYELPDGTEIQVGPDRFKVPEVLFQPSILPTLSGLSPVRAYDGTELTSLPGLVQESIGKCDLDIRRDMYNSIILTGGTALFTGVRERLERELLEVAPQAAKVKVTSPMNPIERRFSVWIGGSILASLGSFQQMWMSKSEYDEHGAALIHRKAP
ncbi:hypothetical protein WJX81_003687 [Elliptochloris bilobata]|uniref:Actin-related protein 4 n=1 Tax=Elliptochloris bilobata TaxID=381761 RepID=A0AAW1S1I6_9CHLO